MLVRSLVFVLAVWGTVAEAQGIDREAINRRLTTRVANALQQHPWLFVREDLVRLNKAGVLNIEVESGLFPGTVAAAWLKPVAGTFQPSLTFYDGALLHPGLPDAVITECVSHETLHLVWALQHSIPVETFLDGQPMTAVRAYFLTLSELAAYQQQCLFAAEQQRLGKVRSKHLVVEAYIHGGLNAMVREVIALMPESVPAINEFCHVVELAAHDFQTSDHTTLTFR